MSSELAPPGPTYVYVTNPTPPINGFAITALICGLLWGLGFFSILAIGFGHHALGQFKHNIGGPQRGKALAQWALLLGYLGLTPWVLFAISMFASS